MENRLTFQQSSIHAIRSFSASFPARRGSMATALMLGLNKGQQKEKRTTNSTTSEEEERGPKRRLVRSATDKTKKSSEDDAAVAPKVDKEEAVTENAAAISVDIKTKTESEDGDTTEPEVGAETTEIVKPETETDEAGDRPKFGSAKEKECWEMYCKMADKGLKVSYDTILRGMLTPTEYRMRRKESVGEDSNAQQN